MKMALRQIFVIGGIRSFGYDSQHCSKDFIKNDIISSKFRKQYSNLDFVKRQQLTTPVRFIRNRGHQEARQNIRHNSTSPFEGFVEPKHIKSDVLRKTFMFTTAVSSSKINVEQLFIVES